MPWKQSASFVRALLKMKSVQGGRVWSKHLQFAVAKAKDATSKKPPFLQDATLTTITTEEYKARRFQYLQGQ